MRVLHRRSVSATLAIVFAATLAACGGGTSDTAESDGGPRDLAKIDCPLSALPKSGPKVKISLWYGNQQGENKTIMEDIAKSYNASQDRVEVTASDQGQDYVSMLNKYTSAIQRDTIPNVMFSDSTHAQFLVDSGTIIPGGACAAEGAVPVDKMLPVVKSFYTIDGTYIPGSVNMTATMMYYNRLSYEQAKLPDRAPGTFAELRSDAEQIEAAEVPDMKWPMSMVPAPSFFGAFMTGIGENMVNEDNGHAGHATEATFDTPEAIEILTQLQAMYADGLIAKISNTPGQIDQYLNVAQGKSAMVMEGSAAATTIEAFLGGGLTAKDIEEGGLTGLSQATTVVPGFGPMPGLRKPGQVPVTGGAYWVTNGGTDAQQAAAMDFIRYLNEMPQQTKWLIDGSYLSGNRDVEAQPEVKKFFSESVSGMALKVAADQIAAVPANRPGPLVGPFDQYDKILQSMMESVLFNGEDPGKAVAKAEADVTAALQSYNDENGF
ncbi:MAG TPA: extracellular solute-binding protein [Acidimicrobiales bacterium]|nr:extracellular solute-binding protein [Acidimicrobiales bacterium]